MAVSFFPFNSIVVNGVADRAANAENLAAYLAGFFSDGVIMQADTALQVAVDSGMNLQILAGTGNIKGKTILNTTAASITIDAASATLKRIDRVIFRLDENNRLMEFDVLKGTAASSPAAPALTRSGGIYEMCLAEVSVPAGATSILASYITDTRSDSSKCGIASIPPHMQDIAHGGTGATTAAAAKKNLGLTYTGAAASARGSANASVAASAITNVTLNTWIARTDTKFTFSGGGIKCPYAGTVEISGSVYLTASSGTHGCYVVCGSNETSQLIAASSSGGVASGSLICNVNAGDVIYLKGRSSVAGNIAASNVATHLDVKYIK